MNDLKEFFNKMKDAEFSGVSGVIYIQGKASGPTLGITACTHGNEPSGLAVFKYLLDEFHIKENLERGSLYLVLNNIKATEKNFEAHSKEEKVKARFVDINMNRLPSDLLSNIENTSYEVARTRELLPIFEKFEYGLDIHSTTQDSDPMIINIGGDMRPELIHGFPIQLIISNIDVVQMGKPVSSFYGTTAKPATVFVIESGTHEDPRSFKTAIGSTISLLRNLKMISGLNDVHTQEYTEYYIDGSLVFPNDTFQLVRPFTNFEFILEGTLIASGDTGSIFAPFDCHVVFCPAGVVPNSYDEEVLFYSRPVKKLTQ